MGINVLLLVMWYFHFDLAKIPERVAIVVAKATSTVEAMVRNLILIFSRLFRQVRVCVFLFSLLLLLLLGKLFMLSLDYCFLALGFMTLSF